MVETGHGRDRACPVSTQNKKNKSEKMTKKNFSYEKSMKELEGIMLKLENEEIDIDELADNIKKAGKIIVQCREKLRITEDEVESIIEQIKN